MYPNSIGGDKVRRVTFKTAQGCGLEMVLLISESFHHETTTHMCDCLNILALPGNWGSSFRSQIPSMWSETGTSFSRQCKDNQAITPMVLTRVQQQDTAR